MLTWLSENWGTLLVLVILTVIVAVIISRLIKNKKEGKCLCQYAGGCGGNCASCHGCAEAHEKSAGACGCQRSKETSAKKKE